MISLARGTISPEHTLYFSRNRDIALGNADVILVVGTPLDFRLGYGKPPAFNAEASVIRIMSKLEDTGRNRQGGIVIAGDIKTILEQISLGMPSSGANKMSWVGYLREKENALIERDRLFITSDTIPIHPLRLCYEIKKAIDSNTTIIADGGDIVRFASHVIQANYPAHWLDPGPMGTLGVGGGYALAAKLLRPDEQVLIINGDGTFGLSCMEFDTMTRHKLNVVSVIGNDSAWSQVRHIQLGAFKSEIATKLGPLTRYDKLVESLGGHGELVQAASDIRPALERAFASGKPACVNVITDGTVSYAKYRVT